MILDRNDLHRDWGPSAYNIPNQASISGTYELPFGKGKHWANNFAGFGNRLVSGWQLNTIVALLSGFPFTPQIGSNRSGDGDTRNPDRPIARTGLLRAGGVRESQSMVQSERVCSNPSRELMETWGAVCSADPGSPTWTPRYSRTPAISKRAHLQLRTEVFNLLNRANFGTPNATVFSNGAFSPFGGIDHFHRHHLAPDPIRAEAHVLMPIFGSKKTVNKIAANGMSVYGQFGIETPCVPGLVFMCCRGSSVCGVDTSRPESEWRDSFAGEGSLRRGHASFREIGECRSRRATDF